MKVVDPSQPSTRALGDLSRRYTDEEIANATINTNGEDNDWIRTVDIPELILGSDYKVSQQRPMFKHAGTPQGANIDEEYSFDQIPAGELSPTIVTIYRLPKNRTLTFFINAWTEAVDAQTPFVDASSTAATNKVRKVRQLDLEHPYMTAFPSRFPLRVDDETVANYKPDPANKLPLYNSLMSRHYLPMYGQITGVEVFQGKLYGKQLGRDIGAINTVYVERAVAEVQIHLQTLDEVFPDKVLPDEYYILSNASAGRHINMLSIIPDNWAGLQAARQKWSSEANAQSQIPYLRERIADSVDASNTSVFAQGWREPIFMPENFPTVAGEQSTIRVAITKKFRVSGSDTFTEVGPDSKNYRNFKQFDILLGEKSSATGLYELRRNTLYRLSVRLKKQEVAGEPMLEVVGWDEEDLPKEL